MPEETKKLGVGALVALVVSSSIGSGIFGIPTDMAGTSSPGAAIIAWIVVGIGALLLCLCFTNLIAKRPDLSGVFSYAEAGFGPFGGFISGWGYWLSAWLGNVAFATMMMSAVAYFIPAFGTGQNILSIIVASIVLWFMCFIVNKGVESAAILNVIVTVCKLVPLFLFNVIAIIAFKAEIFTADFWGTVSGNFELTDVFGQIQNSMMVLMWVFVGIEGAAMLADRAKTKAVAAKSTVIGLVLLLVVYTLTSLLPYGLMTRDEIVKLGQPSLGYILADVVGPWGAALINLGLIISIFGCWLSWTMLPAETTLLMAKRNLLPKKFGEVNEANSPTYSLVFMTILTQIFIFTLLFTEKAYNFAYSLCTAAIFVSWIMVAMYQVKYSYQHRKEKGESLQLVIGLITCIFYGWAIYASGFEYFLLCFTAYILGIFFYYQARKEINEEKVFNFKELFTAGVINFGACIAIYLLVTGKIVV
ncbi:arginine:ornithine antiporter (APA family) [Lachnotalea glycerini]|uniref:Arginine-ornithine antiporter n=1 Tax=Lachnotalea glycerini TaxID=1763509 RepID=A0A318EVT7_9FIRM|nr:arginine-ornithine antiporter [Lachnotalea glycerini]PXV93660.1 arginine:ornithine antiporter (APA family) [Lachnotalea glycerini]